VIAESFCRSGFAGPKSFGLPPPTTVGLMIAGRSPEGLRPLLHPWVSIGNLISQIVETPFASIPSLPRIAS
jgi:hypothetical protein